MCDTVRLTVDLPAHVLDRLSVLARNSNRSTTELIRDAVCQYIDRSIDERRQAIVEKATGLWKDRDDLPDFRSLRNDWDRD